MRLGYYILIECDDFAETNLVFRYESVYLVRKCLWFIQDLVSYIFIDCIYVEFSIIERECRSFLLPPNHRNFL